MASAKDTFESHTFAANSFACGVWRGIGVATATLVGRWSNVITARAFTGPIIVSANTGPITARAETKVEL
jgi:hypothetical protein